MKHYLQFNDLRAEEYAYLFERAAAIQRKFKAYEKHHPPACDHSAYGVFRRP